MTDQTQPSPTTEPVQSLPASTLTPKQKRRIVLITGGVMLLFGVYLLAFLVPDLLKNMRGPDDMTLGRAADAATGGQRYVHIEDGVWHCDTIEYVRGPSSSNRRRIVTRYTEAFLTDANRPERIVLFATFSGEKSCEEIEGSDLNGYLKRMSNDTRQALTNDVRLARFYDASVYLEMCAYCGPNNSLIGTIFGTVFVVGGVALLGWGWRLPTGPSPPTS